MCWKLQYSNGLSNKVCVPNETEDVNVNANVNINLMVKNVIQIKSGTKMNVDVSVKIQKKYHMSKKDHVWNRTTCSCKNGKYY